MNDTLASAPHQAAWPKALVGPAPVGPASMPRRRPATLLGIIATWEERLRVRWELEQMARANPRLIDDIGLTRRQVEAEIAKPFWQR